MKLNSIFTEILDKTSEIYDSEDIKIIQPSGIEDYSKKVLGLLKKNSDDNRTNILAVSGTPGAGKGGFIKELAYLIKISLKKKVKGDDSVIKLGDYDDHNNHYLYVMLDGFFKEIGKLRRTEMLRSMNNFLDMFGDDDKAINFIETYLDNNKGFEFNNIYLKRAEERAIGTALSTFKVRKREKNDNSVIILDGLNSHNIADGLLDRQGEEALNIIKVMIFPRLERTFARLVKRDSINSNDGKSIKDVVHFRLKELFYVFNTFTLPSLNQKEIHFFDFSRETDQSLTKAHMEEVIFALEESGEELLEEGLGNEFNIYLSHIVDHMISYFTNMIDYNEYVTINHEFEDSQIRFANKYRKKEEIKEARLKRYNKK